MFIPGRIEVLGIARGLVIQHMDLLAQAQELLHDVGTNKSSASGDEPGFWISRQTMLDFRVA